MEYILPEEEKVGVQMIVKTVGFYKEMPHGGKSTDSILDNIYKENSSMVDSICCYLEKGIEFIVSPGIVNDVINPERGTAGDTSIYTDGKWIWPGDLSYYVRNYKLKLPDAFIDTMKSNNWKIPIKISNLDFNEIVVDGTKMFE